MAIRAAWGVMVGLLILAPIALADDGPVPLARERFGEPGSREWLKAMDRTRHEAHMARERIENCPHSFDVLHYDIDLSIDFDNEILYGDTYVQSVSQEAGLSEITLDLTVLTVDQVLADGVPLTFAYEDPTLTISLDQAYAEGDTFEVEVIYHGHPGNEGAGGFGGFFFQGNPKIAFQMGVGLVADPPSMGKFWFPCWDWPCDKATADYAFTVPSEKWAVSNGDFLGAEEDSLAGTTTYFWSETHQISPHVMMVAAREYAWFNDRIYPWINFWVYPEDVGDATEHFANVRYMMEAFVDRYGPYPFGKFGYVATPKGDMEHQTCVSHLAILIQPNHTYDWLLAHEMGHQWWGDCVTINDWRDIWLSEGFATYSEAIFFEHFQGEAAYHNYVQSSLMNPVFNSSESFPIYDPDYLWGTTVYEKGALVLHMLRHVVGDETFFDILAAYRTAYEYSNAITPQFQEVAETVGGHDLDWFFQEWIYDIGWPEYEYAWNGWASGEIYRMNILIDQVQRVGPIFAMPVDVEISTVAGDTLVVLWVDEEHESFHLELEAMPTGMEIDPDNWILNTADPVAYSAVDRYAAAGLHLAPQTPSSSGAGAVIRYEMPRAGDARLVVFDAEGRQVRTLFSGTLPAGEGEVLWDGCDDVNRPVSSGTYFCRMETAAGTIVRRMAWLR